MSQDYFNENDRNANKQIDNEGSANYEANNINNITDEEEEIESTGDKQYYNKEGNSTSHSRHSSHHINNNFDSDSTYSYSTGSNLIRLSQPSSAVHLHFSGSSAESKSSKRSSKKRNGESSGFYIHLEPSTIERDLNSDKIFNAATNTKPKKNSKPRTQQQQQQKKIPQQSQNQVQPQSQQQIQEIQQQQMQQSPQQRQPRQRNLMDDSPDSYQVSDKFVDRDINLSDNNFNSNEYTYEYISESNSYYKRNLPRIQALQRQQQQLNQQPQQNSPASNLENDSEYTYVYDYPSSELEDQPVPRNGFENRYNNQTPHNYNNNNYSNRNIPTNALQYNNNINDEDSEYTYTYESANGFNDQYQNLPPNQRQQQPQQRTINAELVPQGTINRGAPLVPIQMQIQVPGGIQNETESTNDYTYTYDEPTTEEKMLIESMKNRDIPLPSPNQNANNYSISNIPQVEIPPIVPKKKPSNKNNKNNKSNKINKNKKLSPREKKIQQKINKLQKNLNKLENVPDDEEYEDEDTVDINDNKKVNLLKNKIADLTGWRNSPRNGQIGSYGTNSYTYTFEYESEVIAAKKEPVELRLVSPIGSVSIEAAKQSPQQAAVVERNFLLNDEPAKVNLEISPAVQSESSNMNASSKQKKAEQLQEIFELKRRLQQLQQQVNYNEENDDDDDNNENFSYEPQSSSAADQQEGDHDGHNRIRVKKRVRVAKQVKLPNDLKQQQQQGESKKPTKMKKIQKRVRVERNASHHHHHHSHRRDSQNDDSLSSQISQGSQNYQKKDDREMDEDFVTRDVVLDEDSEGYENQSEAASTASTYRNSTASEALQLLDESSSPQSSAVIPQFTSPKSPLRLLDEGSESDEEDQERQKALKVKVVEVENLPDVAAFCVAFIDSTGDARKTSVAARGSPKEFDEVLSFPLREVDEDGENNLVVLVKRHDLIKNDRLLGTAKVAIDFARLRRGDEVEQVVQLTSDAGIATQSQAHIIMSLHDINDTDTKRTSPQTVEFVTQPLQDDITKTTQPTTKDLTTRSVHFTPEEEESDDQPQTKPRSKPPHQSDSDEKEEADTQPRQQQPQQEQPDVDEEEEVGDDYEPLNPSNVRLSSDMKNRLKIHRNFNALKSNEESGVFILEPPSQSPLDAEFDQNPSSSFITDLVRQRSIDNDSKYSKSSNSSSKAKNRSNVNFTKSDKITYNLENDVRLNQRAQQKGARARDLDDADEASESGGSNRDEIRKKRRFIQKIEPTRDEQSNKEPIQIEIDFASNSNSFPDYYSGLSYENDE